MLGKEENRPQFSREQGGLPSGGFQMASQCMLSTEKFREWSSGQGLGSTGVEAGPVFCPPLLSLLGTHFLGALPAGRASFSAGQQWTPF